MTTYLTPPDGATIVPVSTSTIPIDSLISFNHPVSVKLTEDNFFAWKSQILPLLQCYDLHKYLDSPFPSPTITSVTGQTTFNQDYLTWQKQDQYLLSWLRSCIIESILCQVSSATTCKQFWTFLEDSFSSTARVRVLDLKCQLQQISKGSDTIPVFLVRIKKIVDELAALGSPMGDDDLISAALRGLGPEYQSIKSAVITQQGSSVFPFANLKGILLANEAFLQDSAQSSSAFYVGKNSSKSSVYPPKPGATSTTSTNPTRPLCGICDKIGHKVRFCYRRYDKDPQWKPPPKPSEAYATHSRATSSPTDASQPSTSQDSPTEWLLDSGASNHVTNDINKLQNFFAYKGPDKLQIGTLLQD